MSYAQVSLPSTSEILKTKKLFPKLQANKIDNIHKIINDGSKSKPKINMIKKESLRKQVIIPMSNDNKTKFIEISSTHITNINRALKNIKSEVIADFYDILQSYMTMWYLWPLHSLAKSKEENNKTKL